MRLFDGVRPIGPRQAMRDALAGVSLASMNIPQVLGYTRIAGMPVVTGFYTVLLPLVAFAAIRLVAPPGGGRRFGDRGDLLRALSRMAPSAAPSTWRWSAWWRC